MNISITKRIEQHETNDVYLIEAECDGRKLTSTIAVETVNDLKVMHGIDVLSEIEQSLKNELIASNNI